MEAYSTKVREQVLGAYDQGMKTKQIAERFGVGRAWCRGVKQRLREHGLRGAIKQKHGPDPIFDQARREQLLKLVNQTPDATLEELKAKLDIPVSISTIWRTLTDMKLTLKKSPSTPPNGTGPTW
jgi:transposase